MKRYLISGYMFLCAVCLFFAASRQTKPFLETQGEYYRLLQEYNGKIGIYDSEQNLLEVVDYPFTFLTEYDRRAMEEGIPVENEEELKKRIEDYTS